MLFKTRDFPRCFGDCRLQCVPICRGCLSAMDKDPGPAFTAWHSISTTSVAVMGGDGFRALANDSCCLPRTIPTRRWSDPDQMFLSRTWSSHGTPSVRRCSISSNYRLSARIGAPQVPSCPPGYRNSPRPRFSTKYLCSTTTMAGSHSGSCVNGAATLHTIPWVRIHPPSYPVAARPR